MSKILVVLVVLALWSFSSAISATGAGSWEVHQNGVKFMTGLELREGKMDIIDIPVKYEVLHAEAYVSIHHHMMSVRGKITLAEARILFSEKTSCSVSIRNSADAEVGLGYASWSIEAGVLTFECQHDTATGVAISAKYQQKLFSLSGHVSIWDTRLQAKLGPCEVGFRFDKEGVGFQVSVFGQEAILHVDRGGVSILFKNQMFGIQTKTSYIRVLEF